MKLEPVESTSIAAIGYDAAEQVLGVEFTSGTLYHYAGVPEAVYQGFLDAGSKGTYFRHVIRGYYTYKKVEHAS